MLNEKVGDKWITFVGRKSACQAVLEILQIGATLAARKLTETWFWEKETS